jgi:hypothetical protein
LRTSTRHWALRRRWVDTSLRTPSLTSTLTRCWGRRQWRRRLYIVNEVDMVTTSTWCRRRHDCDDVTMASLRSTTPCWYDAALTFMLTPTPMTPWWVHQCCHVNIDITLTWSTPPCQCPCSIVVNAMVTSLMTCWCWHPPCNVNFDPINCQARNNLQMLTPVWGLSSSLVKVKLTPIVICPCKAEYSAWKFVGVPK